jgi:hypothetical protein
MSIIFYETLLSTHARRNCAFGDRPSFAYFGFHITNLPTSNALHAHRHWQSKNAKLHHRQYTTRLSKLGQGDTNYAHGQVSYNLLKVFNI